MMEENFYERSPKYNLSYYGADYPVDSLVHRMDAGEIVIPHFQREYVWNHGEASRFIESLILRLPVPSIFLLRDPATNNLIIIDGQQRLKTLLYFFKGFFPDGRKFTLKDVLPQYNKLTFDQLSNLDRRELVNSIIHCIIIMDDENSDAPFHLFERLNTTGSPLTNQEIRSALYFGEFNNLLKELSEFPSWTNLVKKDNRLTDQEHILRLIAFFYHFDFYNGEIKTFLNLFMMDNRNLSRFSKTDIEHVFYSTMKALSKSYKELKGVFSITFFEPLFYVLGHALQDEVNINQKTINSAISEMVEDPIFASLCKQTSKGGIKQKFLYVREKFY